MRQLNVKNIIIDLDFFAIIHLWFSNSEWVSQVKNLITFNTFVSSRKIFLTFVLCAPPTPTVCGSEPAKDSFINY